MARRIDNFRDSINTYDKEPDAPWYEDVGNAVSNFVLPIVQGMAGGAVGSAAGKTGVSNQISAGVAKQASTTGVFDTDSFLTPEQKRTASGAAPAALALPMVGLDYGTRAMNTGIATAALTAEAVVTQEYSSVPYMRDGISIGDVGELVKDSWGENIEIEGINGELIDVQNSITAGQGISTLVGRGIHFGLGRLNENIITEKDKDIEFHSAEELNAPWNERHLYSWQTGLYSGFDITDYQQKDSAYGQGLGRWITGSADAGIQWFVGVDVLAGKAAGMAGRVLFTRSLDSLQDVNKMTDDLVANDAWRKGLTEGQILDEAGNVVRTVPARRTDAGRLAESFVKMSEKQVLKHKIASSSTDSLLVARVLGKAKDYETVQLGLRAFLGDQAAVSELTRLDAIAGDALSYKRSQIENLKGILNMDVTDPRFANANWAIENIGRLNPVYEAALKENEPLRDLVATFSGGASRINFDKISLSKFESGPNSVGRMERQAEKAAVRDERGLWTSETFRTGGGFGRVVRVMKSPADYMTTSRQMGKVDLTDADKVVREVDAIFQTTKFFRKLAKTSPDMIVTESGETVAQFRSRVYQEMVDARTPSERWEAFQKFDASVAKMLAKSYGIDDTRVASVVGKYKEYKEGLLEQVQRHGYFEDSGDIIAVPQYKEALQGLDLQSKKAETYFATDFNFLETVFRLETGSGLRKTGTSVSKGFDEVFSRFDSIWRPLVLMRLGYTQRNVAEGWLRELAAYGTIGGVTQRSKGGTMNPEDQAFVKWASSAGRVVDKIGGIPRIVKYGSIRKAMKNLDTLRGESVKSGELAAESRKRLSSIERLAETRAKYLAEQARERVAKANIDRLDGQVGVVVQQIDDEFTGSATDAFDNGQEIWIPSQNITPLLSAVSKVQRRSRTVGAFDNADDAMMRQVNDESIPSGTVDEFIGIEDDIPLDTHHDLLEQFLGKNDTLEYQNIRAANETDDQIATNAARLDELQNKAYMNAATEVFRRGHRLVRVVDSGIYQIVHSLDEVDVDDILSGNLGVVLKENIGNATAVRATAYGDVLDLRTKSILDVEEARKLVPEEYDPTQDERVSVMYHSIFDDPTKPFDRANLNTRITDDGVYDEPLNRMLDALETLVRVADADPSIAEAIAERMMLQKLPPEVFEYMSKHGLVISSKQIKSLSKRIDKNGMKVAEFEQEVWEAQRNLEDSISEFDWSEFGVFHGGTRVKDDVLADDPLNTVDDAGAVARGVGFYTTEDPEIAVTYIVNRALDKDGEPVFYAIPLDQNAQKFMYLDDLVDSYEAESEMKRILAKMQERFGDEVDNDTAWEEIDAAVTSYIDEKQFPLQGDPEVLPYDINQYRFAMIDYFQKKIADWKGVTDDVTRDGRIINISDGAGWADTEYEAQMLWVDALRDEGYQGVSHVGGRATATNPGTGEHQVFIWYNDPELTRVDEISDAAIGLQIMQKKYQKMFDKLKYAKEEQKLRASVAPYERKFDANGMTLDFEKKLGTMMSETGRGRIFVDDSLSPSGYRLIVNPDMMSVNTDQLDAAMPGSIVSNDYADRTLEALQQEATVRHPQVLVPSGLDDEAILSQFGGDTAVLSYLRTGKGSPEVKATVARYMETRQGPDGPMPYTHVEVGNKGKFVTVSEMLGNKMTGAAYRRNLEGDDVDAMATMMINNDPQISTWNKEIGSLRQETRKTADDFLADQEAAKAAAELLKKRLGRRADGRQRKKKLGTGKETFDGKSYESFDEDGVFSAAQQGEKNALDAGADSRVQMELYGLTDRSQRLLQRTAEPTTYTPGDESYWETFSDEVNKIWRNDPVGELLFKGTSIEDIYTELKRTDRGRAWIRDIAGISDFRGYVTKDILNENAELAIMTEIADRQAVLNRLLPATGDEKTRIFDHISTHDVTPMWLRTELGWRADLGSLEGFGTQYKLGKNWRSFTSSAMRILGSTPENALVRHPFYRARWREEMQRQADIYGPQVAREQGVERAVFDDALINTMNQVAKKRALRQVNDTLYTIQQVSTPAHMFRYLVPFFPAWASAMKFWLLKQPVEKPETLARYGLAFNAPEAIGMFKDENGNTVADPNREGNFVPAIVERLANKITGADEGSLSIQLSPGVANAINDQVGGNTILGVSKGSLDFLLQGEFFYVPGFGPLVTLPLSWLASQRPDIATELETGNYTGFSKFAPISEIQKSLYGSALPFGPSKEKNILDIAAEQFLPATLQRPYQAFVRGTDSATFSNAATTIYQTQIIDWELSDREGEKPSFLKATEQAGDFFRFRGLVSGTAPAAITFRSKYQFYIDEWRRIETKAYEPEGGGAQAAQTEFINKYGTQFFAATMSLSSSTSGISATTGEYKAFDANPELMAGLATYGDDASYITMATRPFATSLNEDGFDPAVYAWQFNRSIEGASGKFLRSGSDQREDMLLSVDKEVGWYKFNNKSDRYDAMLATGGIDENQYNALRSAAAQEIGATNEGWWKEYNDRGGARYIDSVRALDDILGNETYMKENGDLPYVQAMIEFRGMRDSLMGTLRDRKAAGGSDNIDAKQNAGIAAAYAMAVLRIGATDPSGEFTRMHSRFFGSDKLKPIPGRDS